MNKNTDEQVGQTGLKREVRSGKYARIWAYFLISFISFIPVFPRSAKAQSKPQPPTVNLWVARDVAPGPKIQININTRNLERVRLSAWRLTDTSWLLNREPGDDSARHKPEVAGAARLSWFADMRALKEKKQAYQIDWYRARQLNLPPLIPGIYLITAEGGGESAWGVVNITNLAIVVKRSPKKLLAWVTDFRSGVPLANARVALWNRDGTIAPGGSGQVAGATGKDGAALMNAPPGSDQVLVVTRGNDAAGVKIASQNPDGRLTMHFQTDRPIYRPGHTAHWKAILRRTRGRGWEPVANVACTVQVRDARDIVLFEQNLKTNAIGTLESKVDLPEEGSLGQYSVTISPAGAETQYAAFSVAAYRKPEFQVAIAPAKKRYLSGEKVVFNLKATYYFGAVVPGATVRYIVRRGDLPFGGGDDGASFWYGGDGNLYGRDTYSQNEVVADATADLDASGQLAISVPAPDSGNDSTYSIAATVIDGSRREVEASSSVPVFRAAKRISVSGEVSYVPVGFLMPLQIRVSDLDGKPTNGHVTLVLKKPVWNAKEQRTRYVEVTRTSVDIPASGKAKASLPAQAEGELLIEATMPDGTGRTAQMSFNFWVAGPFTSWQREDTQPTLTLKPDKRFYKPGETAKILVATNTPTRPVLAVAEGLDIWNYVVIPAGKRNFVWNVPARVEMSPNAYASAMQWTRAGMISDNAVLPIPDPSRKLNVTLTADKTVYRPGESARYILKTTDENGRGVAAEVAVAVVDESLYAVRPDNTPDLYGLFWAMRSNFVSTATSAPEEMSGGAYQRVNKMASVRKQFADTGYWNARLQTDATGTASFMMQVPGNLTTWRATARAITADTRVGMTTSSVLATRPVTLRLATPRQMVQGDELTLIGSVNNRTKIGRTFETALSGEGIQVGEPRTQKVTAGAGGEGKAQWPIVAATLPANGEAKLTARTLDETATNADAQDLSDALEVRLKIEPNGVLERMLSGGTLETQKTATVKLPDDAIVAATSGVLSIRGGLGDLARGLASSIANNSRWAANVAAARLLVAALSPQSVDTDEARENIAMLARYQTGQGGWGWWEDDRPDAQNTAFVLSSLARAKAQGINVPAGLVQRGLAGARALYDNDQLWEHRALLASAIALADTDAGTPLLDEVARRAENLSPYAHLVLGEALLQIGRENNARDIAELVLKEAVVSPESATLRVGSRPGWTASADDANAAALSLLLQLGDKRELQTKLARRLADGEENYASLESQSARFRALWKYDKAHPSATERGRFSVSINGQKMVVPSVTANVPLDIPLPRGSWKAGGNVVEIARDGTGEIFYSVEARVYRPAKTEFGNGVRVFRRMDAQNDAKAWDELKRAIRPGEPIRCTVVVWPGERADALRVTEPLPAGFEYIESDDQYGTSGFSEVRDNAVVHYVRGNGLPITFRYYMRAESEGRVTALPAFAEVLRRPEERGNSDALRFVIEKSTP